MKRTNDLIIKRYVKKVLQLTPSAYRSHLKRTLQNNVTERFHDVPELTVSMIQERFGTPEDFATEYLSGMDMEELQTTLKHSKKQKRVLTIALICLLLLLIPISIWIVTEGDRHVGFYYTNVKIDHSAQ